ARVTEIISGSSKSFQDAVETGIERANKTLKNVEGAWVKDQSLILDNGKIKEYRVVMKVTFVLKD
ncbi:MAG: dodecin family protein, partial [Pseudomonadota bacterium]